jgi:hypothetical protein
MRLCSISMIAFNLHCIRAMQVSADTPAFKIYITLFCSFPNAMGVWRHLHSFCTFWGVLCHSQTYGARLLLLLNSISYKHHHPWFFLPLPHNESSCSFHMEGKFTVCCFLPNVLWSPLVCVWDIYYKLFLNNYNYGFILPPTCPPSLTYIYMHTWIYSVINIKSFIV